MPKFKFAKPRITTAPVKDAYTPELLKRMYNLHKEYILASKDAQRITGVKWRLPAFPEHISENIAKFVLRRNGDTTCTWACTRGDLESAIEGKQEIKAFSSDGPPSFTPSSEWDVIYFLDARDWLKDQFVLYRVGLKRTDKEFADIKVNKDQSFGDQAEEGRRPRITWKNLKPQIETHTTVVYEGTFDGIFKCEA